MIEPLDPPRASLRLGAERRDLELPRGPRWERLGAAPLRFPGSRPLDELGECLHEALERSGRLARGARVVVVLPDLTRSFPGRAALAAIAAVRPRIVGAGAHLLLRIACGVHRPPEAEALFEAWGEAARVLAPVAHDPDLPLSPLGRTRRGTPVALARDYAEAELRLTLGAVTFHYFAGFGGGPKLVFPGLASRAGALANHRLSLGPLPPGGLDPGAAPGRLRGNPVAEDLAEAAAFRPPELTHHFLPAADGWRFACGTEGAEAARDALLESGTTGEEGRYDLVVASAGGAPRDVDLVQSHKALFHAARYLRDGGGLVLLAATPRGAGSASLERWLGIESLEELERRARAAYDGNAQTAISLRRQAARVRIHWVGSRAPALVAQSGAIPCESAEEALGGAYRAARASGAVERGALLPASASIVPESATDGLPGAAGAA